MTDARVARRGHADNLLLHPLQALRPSSAAKLILASLLAFSCSLRATARPQFFPDVIPGSTCTQHPDRNLAEFGAPHGEPRADSDIVFTLFNAGGNPAARLCPGANHALTVTFPEARLALLTASKGEFAPVPPSISHAGSPGCANRMDLGRSSSPNKVFNVAFTLPCNATDSVQFRITSAAPTNIRWSQANMTVDVSTDCAAAACGGPALASQPAPSPPPSPAISPLPVVANGRPSYGGSSGGYGYGGYGGGSISAGDYGRYDAYIGYGSSGDILRYRISTSGHDDGARASSFVYGGYSGHARRLQ